MSLRPKDLLAANTVLDIVDLEGDAGVPPNRKDQTFISYDMPDPDLPAILTDAGYSAAEVATYRQTFLLGTASKTWNENGATWYSYDELGRMTWSVKQIAGLDGVFTMHYEYNFQGELLRVIHNKHRNPGTEGIVHEYTYDLDGRMVEAHFGDDASTAPTYSTTPVGKYEFYAHGPTKRVELGDQLQGMDFVYTVDGRLKSINHPGRTTALDPGGDAPGQNQFATDVFGMELDYFSGDYERSGTSIGGRTDYLLTQVNGGIDDNQRFNGQIRGQRWRSKGNENSDGSQSVWDYQYQGAEMLGSDDQGPAQLERAMFGKYQGSTATAQGYETSYQYSVNGNLTSLVREDQSGTAIDQLTYIYQAHSNRLQRIDDAMGGLP